MWMKSFTPPHVSSISMRIHCTAGASMGIITSSPLLPTAWSSELVCPVGSPEGFTDVNSVNRIHPLPGSVTSSITPPLVAGTPYTLKRLGLPCA